MKTVTIISCAREPTYLVETLNSFKEPEVEVELVFQGNESAEMLEFLRHQNIEFQENPIAALCFDYVCDIPRVYRTEKISDSVQLNGQYNYAQTLLHTKEGLIVEDDVQVSKNFCTHINEVEKLIAEENSVVALYSFQPAGNDRKIELIEIPVYNFRNTQAMMYPVDVAKAFGQHILNNLGKEPYDHALRTFCRKNGLKLFATNYSLVQHIGRVTTGLGYHHRAKNFIDDYL